MYISDTAWNVLYQAKIFWIKSYESYTQIMLYILVLALFKNHVKNRTWEDDEVVWPLRAILGQTSKGRN